MLFIATKVQCVCTFQFWNCSLGQVSQHNLSGCYSAFPILNASWSVTELVNQSLFCMVQIWPISFSICCLHLIDSILSVSKDLSFPAFKIYRSDISSSAHLISMCFHNCWHPHLWSVPGIEIDLLCDLITYYLVPGKHINSYNQIVSPWFAVGIFLGVIRYPCRK